LSLTELDKTRSPTVDKIADRILPGNMHLGGIGSAPLFWATCVRMGVGDGTIG